MGSRLRQTRGLALFAQRLVSVPLPGTPAEVRWRGDAHSALNSYPLQGRGCVIASKTARQLLLTATGGRHASKGEKVDPPEISGDLTVPGRKRQSSLRLDRLLQGNACVYRPCPVIATTEREDRATAGSLATAA